MPDYTVKLESNYGPSTVVTHVPQAIAQLQEGTANAWSAGRVISQYETKESDNDKKKGWFGWLRK